MALFRCGANADTFKPYYAGQTTSASGFVTSGAPVTITGQQYFGTDLVLNNKATAISVTINTATADFRIARIVNDTITVETIPYSASAITITNPEEVVMIKCGSNISLTVTATF